MIEKMETIKDNPLEASLLKNVMVYRVGFLECQKQTLG